MACGGWKHFEEHLKVIKNAKNIFFMHMRKLETIGRNA